MAGQQSAEYAAFYVAQFRAVARTVYLILYDREHAEDVTQDAFVQLYLHWSKVARYEAPHAWVRRVAIRLAVRSAHRERRGRQLAKLDRAAAAEPGPADIDLMRAAAALPAQQRAAVALYYYEDRPMSEVADLLGCSVAAAKVTLHRARRALADRLADGERDDVR
ncbi:MAG TPA: sigma-70 family RNA polymerase sigma factor [Micromonosporaceae bacterium]|nr:sigma-70 family RNA polymerase sigma factor [Micromonosporaceae bacterium]